MRQPRSTAILMTLAITLLAAGRSAAGEGHCAHCGRTSDCRKVCRLVPEDCKLEKVCWGCRCDDFCVPGPSKPGCENSEQVCESCPGPHGIGVYAEPHQFLWTNWLPGRKGKLYTRKKLMKKIETRTVPGYKWVVEELCSGCQAQGGAVNMPSN